MRSPESPSSLGVCGLWSWASTGGGSCSYDLPQGWSQLPPDSTLLLMESHITPSPGRPRSVSRDMASAFASRETRPLSVLALSSAPCIRAPALVLSGGPAYGSSQVPCPPGPPAPGPTFLSQQLIPSHSSNSPSGLIRIKKLGGLIKLKCPQTLVYKFLLSSLIQHWSLNSLISVLNN